MGAKEALRSAPALMTAAIAPVHGPNRMAIGSVTTRPSIGAAVPTAKELIANPAAPASTTSGTRRSQGRFMEYAGGGEEFCVRCFGRSTRGL